MSNRRHYPSENDHTPHRRSSSRRRSSPRADFAQHQHPPPPLQQLHPTDSRALRIALVSACNYLNPLLVRLHNEELSPEHERYKRAVKEVKCQYNRLCEPHCEEERRREKTQMAMLRAEQLNEMNKLLTKQWNDRRSLEHRANRGRRST
ncbi:uncharacterized protein H6S33_008103 [Morchella sextelata]|uniref:uncharacterized protein n=1 Tax=Morchella sextelata TaxID=1174677 RepID=UPI001D052094|nr:uncharacterized protein H6S33_008103 [Morchella sextelata]KAH0603099.1 hypothetical protein H6S33_008103 [Morchella sextelata]